jgi:scyllo-inositol 2-dehydrogenase (NADP+)
MSTHKIPIEVGLIGYGHAGRVFHAPLLDAVDGLRLRTIVQRRGEEARERYPDVGIARDVDGLLDDRQIELVVVATPNSSHFDLARRALLADKHVVVDKPFTVTSQEAEQLISLARERKRILTVFQNRRWEGDFLTVRRLIEDKTLGRLVAYEARFERYRNLPRPGAWREAAGPGSGILYDLGSHLIDQALLLFGLPERITADIRRERDFGDADDSFEIWMDYPRLKVTLLSGMLVREKTPRYTLRGIEGTFVKYGVDPQPAALAAGRSPRETGWGREPREQWGTLITDRGEETIGTLPGNYPAFYENVRDAIRSDAPLQVEPEQARTTIEMIELALQSSRDAASIRVTG